VLCCHNLVLQAVRLNLLICIDFLVYIQNFITGLSSLGVFVFDDSSVYNPIFTLHFIANACHKIFICLANYEVMDLNLRAGLRNQYEVIALKAISLEVGILSNLRYFRSSF